MKLRLILASALLAMASAAGAQTLLGGAEISHKFRFGLNLGAGVEYRSADWFSSSDQWSAEVSASYKPLKPLKIGLSYKFIQAYTPEQLTNNYRVSDFWASKHRVSLGVTGEWKPLKVLTLSLRERYQYTYRSEMLVPRFDRDEDDPAGNKTVAAKSKHVLRSRVMAEIKPSKKCRWTPYWGFELYSLLAEQNHTKDQSGAARFCEKWRVTCGTDFKINRHNSLDIFYRFAKTTDADEFDSPHTIGLVYSFKL